jgi:hypothetical protein
MTRIVVKCLDLNASTTQIMGNALDHLPRLVDLIELRRYRIAARSSDIFAVTTTNSNPHAMIS